MTKESQVLFRIKKGSICLPRDKIIYAESQQKRKIIHTEEGDVAVYLTMEELEERLGSGFIRCHRSYLVNMAQIVSYSRQQIRLKNGQTVYVSKNKASMVREAYLDYLAKSGVGIV